MEPGLDWHTASKAVGRLSGQLAQLHAQLVATTVQIIADEAWAGDGIRSVEHFLEFRTGLDRGTVRKLTTIARRVDELPEAIARLNEGRLTLDQVAVLADRVPATHSADVTKYAENATVTQLRRGLSGWFAEPRKDESPKARPDTLQLTRLDDQFLLRYTTGDLVKAELVEQAIREAKDALFTAGQAEAPSPMDSSKSRTAPWTPSNPTPTQPLPRPAAPGYRSASLDPQEGRATRAPR
ncbi:MAG: DUF222 domain-containing protein [Propionicimonas sp.]